MGKPGRPKKYKSAKALSEAVERYFQSITRRVKVTELQPTGSKDDKGHEIYERVPVKNALDQEVWVTEYIVPPSMADLYDALGIDKSTWANYSDPEMHPELIEVTARVYERMKAWNEKELLTRSGKDIKGIVFNLENNYGYRERRSVEVTGGVEEYLKRLAEQGEGAQEF